MSAVFDENELQSLLGEEHHSDNLLYPSCSPCGPKLTSIDLNSGQPTFNADVFRDSMLIDRLPHSNEPLFYTVAAGGSECGLHDGTDEVFRALLLAALGPVANDATDPTRVRIRDAILSKTSRLQVHVPLMEQQSGFNKEVDVNASGVASNDISRSVYMTPGNDCPQMIIVDTTYKRNLNHVSITSATRIRIQTPDADGSMCTHFEVRQSHDGVVGCVVYGAEPTVDVELDQVYARKLLNLFLWDIGTVERARGKFAPEYIPALYVGIASIFTVQRKNIPLWISLVMRQGCGYNLKFDSSTGKWHHWTKSGPVVWSEGQMEGVRSAYAHAVTKIHAIAQPLAMTHADHDALAAKVLDFNARVGGGDPEDVDLDGSEVARRIGDGFNEMVATKESVRKTDGMIELMRPWVTHREFAKAIAACRSVAFMNGIQDFDHPYEFRPLVTHLDYVRTRLDYAVDPPTTVDSEAYTALENFVVERYSVWFADRGVCLREADKDAATLLGNPAYLEAANIRMHVGPYSSYVGHFRGRNGKNMRKSMLKRLFGTVYFKDTSASFLTMRNEAGKAYSFLSDVETNRILWVEEAQETNTNNRLLSWNVANLLLFAPGGEANHVDIRVEYGQSKSLKPAIQNVNVSFNEVRIPKSEGIWNKSEVSPYDTVAAPTEEAIAKLVNEDGEGAYRTVLQTGQAAVDRVKSDPGKIMRYYITRAIAIGQDQANAHPITEKHLRRMSEVREYIAEVERTYSRPMALEGRDLLQLGVSAETQLDAFVRANVEVCKGSAAKPFGDAAYKHLQETRCVNRCFCAGVKQKHACHLPLRELQTLLREHNLALYTSTQKTFMESVVSILGMPGLVFTRAKGVPMKTVFGYRMRQVGGPDLPQLEGPSSSSAPLSQKRTRPPETSSEEESGDSDSSS